MLHGLAGTAAVLPGGPRPLAALCLLLLAACEAPAVVGEARGQSEDLGAFALRAQPSLARSCAFPACHGQAGHGLSLYAVGRWREIPSPSLDELQFAPLGPAELEHNLVSVLGFVDAVEPERSELLVRALPVAEGGRGHGGGVLFADREDPGYRALFAWIEEDVAP